MISGIAFVAGFIFLCAGLCIGAAEGKWTVFFIGVALALTFLISNGYSPR